MHHYSTLAATNLTVVGCSLAPHTSLLMPFSGFTGPVVHLHGLTGLRKAICESRLGYLYPCAWCAWTVQECSFNVLSHKLDFNCCANRDGFCKFSHIFVVNLKLKGSRDCNKREGNKLLGYHPPPSIGYCYIV